MTQRSLQVAQVSGYVCVDQQGTGFALPLLTAQSIPDQWLVQEVDERTGLLTGFKNIEDSGGLIISPISGQEVRVGGPIVYVFIEEDAQVLVGALDTLAPILNEFTARYPDRVATNLQILELIGTPEQKKIARKNMQRTILVQSGAVAAHTFVEGSLLRSVLWDILAANAKDDSAAKRILECRNRIGAKIANSGQISLDLSALDPQDYSGIDPVAIAGILEEEFEGLAPSQEPAAKTRMEFAEISTTQEMKRSDHEDSLAQNWGPLEKIVRRIQNASRQEERIAILLRAILDNPVTAPRLLRIYSRDRAKYAQRAIAGLRMVLEPTQVKMTLLPSSGERSEVDEVELTAIVWRPFSTGMPGNRALLMYYLAKYVGNFPKINKFLQSKLDRATSIFLEPYRSEIQSFLNQPVDRIED